MENRFLEADGDLGRRRRKATARSLSGGWVQAFSAADRRLVILIENGGIDLGIPALVDHLIAAAPGGSLIPDSQRKKLVDYLEEKIRAVTDKLLETAELTINRYSAAKPQLFGDVVILRDGTASYQELKNTLLSLSREGKLIDLLILTHGRDQFIAVAGGIDVGKIGEMRREYGKPLSLRSVYMMNCVGSSLNQAWIDAGAKAVSGPLRNNYLPEPTTFFFWKSWTEGQSFENAVTGAYRQTINMMNDAVRGFVRALPIPGSGVVADAIDIEALELVKDSAPVIQGQRSVTISSDDLIFANTLLSSLATTVLPVRLLRALAATESPGAGEAKLSAAGFDFLARFELEDGAPDTARETLRQKAADALRAIQEHVKVPLNQNQTDALVSFVHNIGAKGFAQSTLLRLLNVGEHAGVVAELGKWVKRRQNGALVDVPALVQRRRSEADLYGKPAAPVLAASFSRHSYVFHSPSRTVTAHSGHYSLAQSPVVAGIAIADAIQIGLGTAAIVQAQVSATQGSFSLSYDKAQRLLTSEARGQMPGSQVAKQTYSAKLLYLGAVGFAKADVIIDWEGNPYGEIGTPIIRRNLSTSSDWSKSSANVVITEVDRIPLPDTDPRAWPIVYSYEGTYDPAGNGHWEFSGEFEINAFGGLKFNRHEVVSRSLLDLAIMGKPEDYVVKGADLTVPVPAVPAEQLAYLKARLP